MALDPHADNARNTRQRKAYDGLKAFVEETNQPLDAPEERQEAAQDLLANLLHMLREDGYDPKTVLPEIADTVTSRTPEPLELGKYPGNSERAIWAEDGLNAFASDRNLQTAEERKNATQTFVTALKELAKAEGADPENTMQSAAKAYVDEVEEERLENQQTASL